MHTARRNFVSEKWVGEGAAGNVCVCVCAVLDGAAGPAAAMMVVDDPFSETRLGVAVSQLPPGT